MKEKTRHGLGARVIEAFCASALMVVAALGIVMGSTLPALAADADQDIYAIFYENPDKKSYTLVIQNGDTVDTSYGELANDGVILICDGKRPDGSLLYACGCEILGSSHESPLPQEYTRYTTHAVVKSGVKPHSLYSWFGGFEGLETADLSGLNSSQVTDMERMFWFCTSLTALDLSTLDTSQVTDMNGMFYECSSLSTLDLSGFDTSQVRCFGREAGSRDSGMFEGCSSLTSLDLSSFDMGQAEAVGGMFSGCSSLESLKLPASLTMKSLRSVSGIFAGCSSLKSIDISQFDTSSATDMSGLFSGCSSLTSIAFPSSFETTLVTSMDSMFAGCSSLESIDLSKFDTGKVTDMDSMFAGCSSLESIQFPSTFTTGWVTSMGGMFKDCSSLASIDLSKFDTSKVTDMESMFYGCSSLESLDLSGFDMGKVENIFWMLSNCSSLGKIILPATGDFAKADLPDRRDGMKWGESLKWRNEKGEVFAADAIPARTAGTYTAVVEGNGSGDGSDGDGSGNGNGGSNGGNSSSNNGSGNGNGSSSGNGNGSGSDGGATAPAPKRTVAFSEAVALPLNATGVAMDKDDIVRDLAKRFGSREGFPTDASSVAVTIMLGGKEVEAIDPTRAGIYEVTAVYSMPDGTERVIEAAYTVADPAAKAPVKSAARSATRLAQTGDEVAPAVPLATAALAACALAAAVAVRRRARG
ncbi:BspA family leucine-rich repeat surface protein [Adlercreutzia muris]|uniref:BspA family leucine-rich repeat surface protein n=1 Tax=Adlercreutzia muris TaxID=1796610 RepID=UPI0035180B5A